MDRNPLLFRLFTFFTTFAVLQQLSEGVHQCQHDSLSGHQLQYAAEAGTSQTPRAKRQSDPDWAPIRITPIYDATFQALDADTQNVLKHDVVEHGIAQFHSIVSVRPLSGKILLQRGCVKPAEAYKLNPGGYCSSAGCNHNTTCSDYIQLPESYFAACEVCDDDGNNCSTLGQDGAGVEGADYLLFVSANLSWPQCSLSSTTIAFAAACQLEKQFDRPIAGFVNICYNKALDSIPTLQNVFFHEVTHALVFSPALYPFYRDENGNPRTARDSTTGLPLHFGSDHTFIPDVNTVAPVLVARTTVPNGTFYYNVSELATPCLGRQARSHFGCPRHTGALLEDVPREGYSGTHFEKTAFSNEIMTASVSTDPVLSNFTLALYEDSGWYKVDYSYAEPFRWGKDLGCAIMNSGCVDPLSRTLMPPYCNNTEQRIGYLSAKSYNRTFEFRQFFGSSCTVDRRSSGTCMFLNGTTNIDPNFQYFSDPHLQGTDFLADYCPYVEGFVSCSKPLAGYANAVNTFGETFGPSSKCVEFRIDGTWAYLNQTMSPVRGGACYEVFCDYDQGPTINVKGRKYSCAGKKEIPVAIVDLPSVATVVTIECPPCEELCWDRIETCKSISPSSSTTPGPSTASPTTPSPTSPPTQPPQPNSFLGASIASWAVGGAGTLMLLIGLCLLTAVSIGGCVATNRRRKARSTGISYQRANLLDDEDDEGMILAND